MHPVLGGLLMLMMTCKEDQDLSLPVLELSSPLLKFASLPKALHTCPSVLCIIRRKERGQDAAPSIGTISDRIYEQLTCKGKQHHSHECCCSQEAQRLRRHAAHHADSASL